MIKKVHTLNSFACCICILNWDHTSQYHSMGYSSIQSLDNLFDANSHLQLAKDVGQWFRTLTIRQKIIWRRSLEEATADTLTEDGLTGSSMPNRSLKDWECVSVFLFGTSLRFALTLPCTSLCSVNHASSPSRDRRVWRWCFAPIIMLCFVRWSISWDLETRRKGQRSGAVGRHASLES